MSETAEKSAKNRDMIDAVRMICKKCGGEVDYKIENRCYSCGYITITCKRCKYKFDFGE